MPDTKNVLNWPVPSYKSKMTSLGPEIMIKMSLSVQRSVVESFRFNGKNIRAVHVPGL